jgi:hypothetical protein
LAAGDEVATTPPAGPGPTEAAEPPAEWELDFGAGEADTAPAPA